jgi:hypothetical protein
METNDNLKPENSEPNKKEPDVGSGPISSDLINDGGHGGKKQPKEHTGKQTEMGGATGGTSGLADASEGNDNTGSAG